MARTKQVSFSELDNYRQCPFKHQLGYVERWTDPEPGRPLQLGRLFHEVLELHYRRLKEGTLPAGIVQEIQARDMLSDSSTGESTDVQEDVAWMYDGYVRRYGEDKLWTIEDVEFPVGGWLRTPSGGRSSLWFKGKVDLLVRDLAMGGGLWVVDHKTSSREMKGKDLDFEDQMPLYVQALRRKGLDVRGAIYNAVRSKRLVRPMTDGERFKRIPMVFTDDQLRTIELEAYKDLREAYRPRPGGGDAQRRPDSERCGWKCGFTEACLIGRKGGDTRAVLEDTGFVQDFTRH